MSDLRPEQVERLALLVEELGEAAQAVGKVLRHGYASFHPNRRVDNRESLERELGDVLLAAAGDISPDDVLAAARVTAESVGQYLHHEQPVPQALALLARLGGEEG